MLLINYIKIKKIMEYSFSIFKERAFIAHNDIDIIMKTCYFKSFFKILCH